MATTVYTDATKRTIATNDQIATALSEGANLMHFGDCKHAYIYWKRRRYQTLDQMIKSKHYDARETAVTIICDLLYESYREREDQMSYVDHEVEYNKYGGSRRFLDLYYRNGISDHDRSWQAFVIDHAIVEDFSMIDEWVKDQKCYTTKSDTGIFYQYLFDQEMELIKRGARLLKRLISKRSK